MMEVGVGQVKKQPASDHNKALNVLCLFKIFSADFQKSVTKKLGTKQAMGSYLGEKARGKMTSSPKHR